MVEKSNVLMLLHEERNLECMYSNRSLDILSNTSGYKLCSLPVDLFIYSYETDFIQGLLKKNEKKLDRYCFYFTFRDIDDVHSLNNSRFGDFVYI
jgi:hypothetical protein